MFDPVHYLRGPMWLIDGTKEEPGWYFWTDQPGYRLGPHAGEAEAREALSNSGGKSAYD